MDDLPSGLYGLAGLLVGGAVGHAARRGRLCTFGAIEDALLGSDRRRLKVFGLALGVAILAVQALVLYGVLDPALSTYLPPALPVLAILVGGILFGIGMALVGTCAFGSLVRLGGGDLRSLVTLLVIGAVGYATLRGIAAELRIGVLEAVTIAAPGMEHGIPGVIGAAFGIDLRVGLAALLGGLAILVALVDARVRRAPRLLIAGVTMGLGVTAGWVVTGVLVDPFDEPARAQSLSFVGPVAKLLYGVIGGMVEPDDFAIWSCIGVLAGSALAAARAKEARWEAFDDHHEMRRHLVGAVLMGFGGAVAGGCTIGQGLSAGSLLSLSWPLAVFGMVAGAALGVSLLLDGGPGRLFARFRCSRRPDTASPGRRVPG